MPFNGVVISARSNGILVEKVLCGITVDRYNTSDLTAPIKRRDPWIERVRMLCSQPSANVQVDVPPMPALEMSQAEKLEALTASNNERRFIIESQSLMSLDGGQPHAHVSACNELGCKPVEANTITGDFIELVAAAEAESKRVQQQNSILEL